MQHWTTSKLAKVKTVWGVLAGLLENDPQIMAGLDKMEISSKMYTTFHQP